MIHFDMDCEPANDIVVLRILDNDTLSSKQGGFVIGDEVLRNLRIGLYQILKIGKDAKENTGLDVGAYVFADKLASFYHTTPICLMRYNALVMETNLEKTKYRALGGRCIVQEFSRLMKERTMPPNSRLETRFCSRRTNGMLCMDSRETKTLTHPSPYTSTRRTQS